MMMKVFESYFKSEIRHYTRLRLYIYLHNRSLFNYKCKIIVEQPFEKQCCPYTWSNYSNKLYTNIAHTLKCDWIVCNLLSC